MKAEFRRRVLSVVMDTIHDARLRDIDAFAQKISHTYCRLVERDTGGIAERDLLKAVENLDTAFFRVNKVDRQTVVNLLVAELSKIDPTEYGQTGFEAAKRFTLKYLQIGYDKSKFAKERKEVISRFGSTSSPHARLLDVFEVLLEKITSSYLVPLHGAKEFSGIDLSKKVGDTTIGFQIKGVNDDISEDRLRAQTSKALEYHLDGFVWIYGRPPSKKVQTSVEAAYHHFARINDRMETYCAFIQAELLAELLRIYGIVF